MRLTRKLAYATTVAFAAGFAGPALADQSPVTIGVLNDQTGLYADLGGPNSVEAARMAVEDFGGEIFGAPIEVISADHQNRADLASTITRGWIDEDGVDAIFDVPNSAAALAVQEVIHDRQIFFFNSGAGTTRLTGDTCSPTGFHWAYDTASMANGTGRAIVEEGGDSWFFLTADYAFGHSLESETSKVVEEMGGEVSGAVRHPLDTQDFSSYLLQAQGSGAKVIGLANAGTDTTNAIRQASEFGIVQAGQSLASLLIFISDVHTLGLEAGQDLMLTTGFYWDMDDETRAWSARFEERTGVKPTMIHAGVYSSVTHYLEALDAAGTKEWQAVREEVIARPVDDFFGKGGTVREDGRMVHDMYLARVKSPDESEGEWDYYEIVSTVPGEDAFLPMEAQDCAHVNG